MVVKIPSMEELASAPVKKGSAAAQAMKAVETIAQRQIAKEDEIKKLGEQLALLIAALNKIRRVDLPEAMKSAGLKACTLDCGHVLKLDDFVTANITEENAPKAHAWLRKNKCGSLIKHAFKFAFGMGEDKKAKAALAFLRKSKIPFEQKEAVHKNTLTAFVKERLKEGKALPPEIDVVTVPTVEIKRVKS